MNKGAFFVDTVYYQTPIVAICSAMLQNLHLVLSYVYAKTAN